ncbi:hypothetical protein B0T24DRAFT_72913 [Lasiosphaeria ovina]|uniref:Secreted protein n=1 Tax=Lasiosphaeria ovina TaxID=92902 RepID=A0AAE0TYI8_9PEZI|nr:hypothetical protein B0T24DRAFT_72913 [Lasiosphaeria ovina]
MLSRPLFVLAFRVLTWHLVRTPPLHPAPISVHTRVGTADFPILPCCLAGKAGEGSEFVGHDMIDIGVAVGKWKAPQAPLAEADQPPNGVPRILGTGSDGRGELQTRVASRPGVAFGSFPFRSSGPSKAHQRSHLPSHGMN